MAQYKTSAVRFEPAVQRTDVGGGREEARKVSNFGTRHPEKSLSCGGEGGSHTPGFRRGRSDYARMGNRGLAARRVVGGGCPTSAAPRGMESEDQLPKTRPDRATAHLTHTHTHFASAAHQTQDAGCQKINAHGREGCGALLATHGVRLGTRGLELELSAELVP